MRSAKLFWHFQRNDKQRKRKSKNRVAERFKARDFTASHAKAIHDVRAISHAHLAQHGCCKTFRHFVKLPDESLPGKRLAYRVSCPFFE
jgi:hypothetical protein